MKVKNTQLFLTIFIFSMLVLDVSAQEIGLQIVEGQDVIFGDSTSNIGGRMIWNDSKKAIRAGVITSDCTTCWNTANIGSNSFGFGKNTKALGAESAAWGDQTEATQYGSTAWGSFTQSKGSRSTAWGHNTKALANRSTSWGNGTTAFNQESTAWGRSTIASGLQSTTWGESNEASGENSTTWGSFNVAAGEASTAWGDSTSTSGNYSTAWGKKAVTSGVSSTAWGRETIASGDESTAWGRETIASGDGSSAWGEKITAPSSHETAFGRYNTIYVPADSLSWDYNDRLLVIGNGKSKFIRSDAMVLKKNGYLGIGESSPAALIHLNSNLYGDSTGIKISNGSESSFIHHENNGDLKIYKEGIPNQLVLNDNGWIGLGTDDDTYPLVLKSGARCDEDGVWVNASDARLKEKIIKTQYGIQEILMLNPVEYKMKASGAKQVGFIAQEVRDVIPEVVSGIEGDINKGKTLGVSYGNLVAVLVKGIQDQQNQIEKQRLEIEIIKTNNDFLKESNSLLSQRMDDIEALLKKGK